MSESLERRLDVTLDSREDRHRQHETELDRAENAIRDSHRELEAQQVKFATEIRSLIRQGVEQANTHLHARPEHCEFCEVSGYLTGPLFVGGRGCNPIAYELRVNGQEVGETLIVELTHEGMIEAYLGPFRPTVPEADTTRIEFGWSPVPLHAFTAQHASELIVQYLNAVTTRWPLGSSTGLRH